MMQKGETLMVMMIVIMMMTMMTMSQRLLALAEEAGRVAEHHCARSISVLVAVLNAVRSCKVWMIRPGQGTVRVLGCIIIRAVETLTGRNFTSNPEIYDRTFVSEIDCL